MYEELGSITRKMFAEKALHDILNEPALLQYLNAHRPPPKPLTLWERILARLSDYRERIVTAWRVLRGDDIHEDCGDW